MNLIPAQPFLEPTEGNRTGPGLLQVLWNRKSLVILGLVIGFYGAWRTLTTTLAQMKRWDAAEQRWKKK